MVTISVRLITKLLKPQYLFSYFIFPLIIINLIIVLPYASYSHNRIIIYKNAQTISPNDVFYFQSSEPQNLNLSEDSVLKNQYNIKEISLGLLYQTSVKINNISSDIFIVYLAKDFFFNKTIWNLAENVDSIISFELAQNLTLVPNSYSFEELKVEGNNSTIYFNSTIIMEEFAVFEPDFMNLFRRNLDFFSINPDRKFPFLIVPFDRNEIFNLTLSPFQISNNVFHFIYLDYSSDLFEEFGSFRIKGEISKLRVQIINYLQNIYSSDIEKLQVNTQFLDYINLNTGYSFLSDLLIPTLIFLHGFSIGLVILLQFTDRLLNKINTFVKLFLERGGNKIQVTKTILIVILLTTVLSLLFSFLASYLIIDIGINSYFTIKSSYVNVLLITLISTTLISLVSIRRIANYILNFEVAEESPSVSNNSKSKKKQLIIIISLTIIEVLFISLLSSTLLSDFNIYILSNPFYIISITFIFLIVWSSFITDILYRLFRKMLSKIIYRKKLGVVLNKLFNSISKKYIGTLRIFILLFFITMFILQVIGSVQQRELVEEQFNNIGDFNIQFDCSYAQIYNSNFRTIVSDDILFFKMYVELGLYNQKMSAVVYYQFPVFIFSSTNFSKYLILSEITPESINYNSTSGDTQFFVSQKLVDRKELSTNDFFSLNLQTQIESFKITGFMELIPVISLISNQAEDREIRDIYAVLVYDSNEEIQFNDYFKDIVAISLLNNITDFESYNNMLIYFSNLGFNFNIIYPTTLETTILINQDNIQNTSFFLTKTVSIYGVVEIIVLTLGCIYLSYFSILSYYNQVFTSSFVLISRGLSSKKSLCFSLVISVSLFLFYLIIASILSTMMTGVYCIFLSSKYYFKFYPFLNLSELLGIFISVISILLVLFITQHIFKRKIENNLASLLKQAKYHILEG